VRLRRVVVTGGAGFIGSHVCDALLARVAEVVCIDDLSTGRRDNVAHLLDGARFTLRTHDVSTPFDVEGEVDAVLHMASPASPLDYARLPVHTLLAGTLGTHHALQLAERKGARLLLTSTSEVYGDPEVHPQREDYWGNVNPVGPRSVYDEAKRCAEAFVAGHRAAHGVDATVARIFNTYGERMRSDDGRAVPAFVTQALRGEPITVFGDGAQTRSLCHVEDMVGGLLALLESSEPGPVNLGNPHEVTMLELAERVNALCGGRSEIVRRPLPADDPRRRCPDITLARTRLGWEPRVGLDEGLRRTVAWWRSRLPGLALRGAAAHHEGRRAQEAQA
jgi:dTDP-glucose 4,6-dehydratase